MLEFFNNNAISIVGVLASGFIVVAVVKGVSYVYKFSLENKVAKLISKYIPEGIAIGEILKGEKPNEERLYQAVVTVENRVLNALPERLRPLVDKMIDSKKIAREIERELNKDKYEGLAKPTVD